MKKRVAAAALLVIGSVSAFGYCNDSKGCSLYIGAGAAIEAVPSTYDASGTGITLKIGSHLDYILPKLGAEVEYTKSVVAVKQSASNQITVQTVGAYLTYDITFPRSPVFVRPRIGLVAPNNGDKINSTDLILSAGADAGVALNKQVNTYIGYTNLGETINNYVLGLEYKF
jgi:hypothetical protein